MEVVGELKTAREMGLVGCTRCSRVSPVGTQHCPRCGSALQSRDRLSLQKVWAWWRTLVSTQSNTIVGGAVELAQHGSWGVALIILAASVLIPVTKFILIAGLAIGVWRGPQVSGQRRHFLYEVVEYIGRWSMIDVFVVAILSALVQLQALASITPGRASLFFALSVIFTMLSAQSFDSRLIWDTQRRGDAPDHSSASGDVRKESSA